MSRSVRLFFALLAVVALATPPVFACPDCRYSPDGWGFCRYYQIVGFNSCQDIVIDSFSGKTGCSTTGTETSCDWRSGSPSPVADGGFGSDCEYHDAVGNCMTDNPDTWGYA